jgi:hypothetical protein
MDNVKKSIIFHWMNAIFVAKTIPKEDFTGRKAREALAQFNFTIRYNKEFEGYLKQLTAEFRTAVKKNRVGKLLEQYPLPKAVEKGSDHADQAEKEEKEEKEEEILSPIENGLIGLYTADSLTEKSWIDLSGHNNDAENIGSYKEYISFGNNRDNEVVKGNPGSKIIFPPSILPEIYTLVSVARYTDNQKGRIFDGMTKNWLSGFWGEGTNFYHEGWVSSMNGNGNPGNKWIINIDTGDSVWSNGKDITSNSNLTTTDRLTINAGFHQKESSSFEVAYVAVYDRRLNRSEIKEYTEWLSESFNITI